MEKYDQLIKAIAAILNSEGFVKKSTGFYLQTEGHWGIINFQKSRSSTRQALTFTINIGVQSKAIVKLLGSSGEGRPHISECHWQTRAGHLLPRNSDHWWNVDEKTSIESLETEVAAIIISLVLPAVRRHMNDDFLRQQWIDGVGTGITEFQRYVYLTSVLKISRDERLGAVVEEFNAYAKGKPIAGAAREHIMMIS